MQSETQAYLVASILSRITCQHRELPSLLIIRALSLVVLLHF